MPFIETKTTVKLTNQMEEKLKEAYGKDIEIIPGKSENWLMLNFVGGCHMAFRARGCFGVQVWQPMPLS